MKDSDKIGTRARNIQDIYRSNNQFRKILTVNLRAENAELRRGNAELRSRLNINSNNNHKPPSSDGLTKKLGLPKGPAKKSGGQ